MHNPGDDATQTRAATRPRVGRLVRRAEFLAAAKGRRWHGGALSLQAARREGAAEQPVPGLTPPVPRVGLTLTKKVGCAVVRNRARRRLREALRASPDLPLRADHDYVIVGRLGAIRLSFGDLRDELRRAVRAVNGADRAGRADRVKSGKPRTEAEAEMRKPLPSRETRS